MVAFTYRMPAGIPGQVTRMEHATIEPQAYDIAFPFASYGIPAKVGTDSKMQPMIAGDAATIMHGLLVRPYPSNSSQNGLGVAVPPVGGICNILRRGYMMVQLNGSAAAVKDGQAYVRLAGTGTIGGIEAAADSTSGNTVAPANFVFTGPADATGQVEVAFNL